MSAARTEKSRLSDTSFNAGVNPVLDKKAYLEEKAQREQALPRKLPSSPRRGWSGVPESNGIGHHEFPGSPPARG